MDDVSLLTVEKYSDGEVAVDTSSQSSATMIITVKDIGQRTYSLKLYRPESSADPSIPGLINDKHWAFFSPDKVQNIFKRKAFFGK